MKTLNGGVAGLMKKHKIDVLEGTATLAGEGTRGGRTETTSRRRRSCSQPARCRCRSPAPSFGGRVVDTAGMWLMNEQPARLAVVGAGASGAEIASAFGRFGTEVVLIEMLDQILPLEDPEIAKVVASEFKRQNIKIVTGARVEKVEGRQGVRRAHWGEGAQSVRLPVHRRGPRARRRGARSRGRPASRPASAALVEVDERLRTSAEGI